MDNEPIKIPTEHDAIRILWEVLAKNAKSVKRFPTGLAHFVYDVETDDGENIVVRLARPNLKRFFAGALGWYDALLSKDVPLPALYYSTLDESKFGFPVMIMERLPGKDLDAVFPTLTRENKYRIAEKIIAMQRSVGTLPMGHGYGYAFSRDDPALLPQWINVLEKDMNSVYRRSEQTELVEKQVIDRVKQVILSHKDYFETVQPICFLDDITTKNVIIDDAGTLSGIVDVDSMGFGDPLVTLALTRMALLSRGYDTEYTDYWASQLGLNTQQERALNLYSAMFCLLFIGEMGEKFNKDDAIPIDEAKIKRFMIILDSLL